MPTLDVRRLGSQRTRETGALKVNPGLAQYSGGFAREAASVANLASEVAAKAQEAADNLTRRRALAQFQSKFLTDYQALANNIGGYESLPDDARAAANEIAISATDGMRGDLAQQVRQDIEFWMLGREPGIVEDQNKNRILQAQADVHETVQASRQAYFAASDQRMKSKILDNIRGTYRDAVSSGVLSPEQGAKGRDNAVNDLHELEILDAMTTDPRGVLGALNRVDTFQGLDPERRIRLRAQAASQVQQLETQARIAADRAERLAEKELQRQQGLAAFALETGILTGAREVTALDVTQAVVDRKLDPEKGAQIMRLLSKQADAPPKNNDTVSIFIESEIDAGNDAANLIHDRFDAGDLTREETSRLLALNRSAQDEPDKPASAYKRERSFLLTQLQQQGAMEANIGGQNARIASALREYDDRIQQGENPREVANELTERGRLSVMDGNYNFLGSNLLLPRFAQGNRSALDINETEKRLAEAYRRQEIDGDELDRQLQLIEEWRRIMAHNAALSAKKGQR